MNFFARQAQHFRNDMARSCGALLGIVQGVLADHSLNDSEIAFLRDWLASNETVSAAWPGNVVAAQIAHALADGIITSEEREHLVNVLQRLLGGTLEDLADSTHVSDLPIDNVDMVSFDGRNFCLTGNFCFGTKAQCEEAIKAKNGVVLPGITKKLHYLIVGGLGCEEWKHGSFGTKIEKAMAYKQAGANILVVHEDAFAAAIMGR